MPNLTDEANTPAVKSFKSAKYSFLSNSYKIPIYYEGKCYSTVEQAYQASKSDDPQIRDIIIRAQNPVEAIMIGKHIKLRSGWEEEKESILEGLLRQKFNDPYLRMKLLNTGDAEFRNSNNYGDTYWGICAGKGQNKLGIMLMKLREELRIENN